MFGLHRRDLLQFGWCELEGKEGEREREGLVGVSASCYVKQLLADESRCSSGPVHVPSCCDTIGPCQLRCICNIAGSMKPANAEMLAEPASAFAANLHENSWPSHLLRPSLISLISFVAGASACTPCSTYSGATGTVKIEGCSVEGLRGSSGSCFSQERNSYLPSQRKPFEV